MIKKPYALKPGTQAAKIYDTLLAHEYMKQTTLADKTGFLQVSIAPNLTALRRAGLVSYTGIGAEKRWKRHPIEAPMYPPQKDIYKEPRNLDRKKEEAPTPSSVSVIDYLITELQKLRTIVKKEHDDLQYIKNRIEP